MCTQIENVFSHLIPHFHTNKKKKLHSFHFPRPRKKFFFLFIFFLANFYTDRPTRAHCLPQLHTFHPLHPHPITPTLSCKPADVLLRFYVMSTIQYISWNKKTHGKQADDANSTQTNCILVLKTLTQANFQHNCRPERENFRVVVPEKK